MDTSNDTQRTPWGALPGEPIVCRAAESGDVRGLVRLLNLGASVEESNSKERTPLILAAAKQQEDCVCELLQRGADVNAADSLGWTPLLHAARNGNVKCLLLLLEKGAHVNVEGPAEFSPFMCAALGKHAECVQALIDRNVDVNQQTKSFRYSALMMAARHGSESCIRVLVENKANVNATDVHGRTALMWATDSRQELCFDLLVQNNADIHAHDKDGFTALICAAKNGDAALVRKLIGLQVDVNAAFSSGSRANEIASLLAWYESRLVEEFDKGSKGANVGDGLSQGLAFLDEWFVFTALGAAASEGNIECIRILVNEGHADINYGVRGVTPLMIASVWGRKDVVQELADLGANVNVKSSLPVGLTALMLACISGQDNCLATLLECGARQGVPFDDPGVCDAFLFAVLYLREDCVRFLLDGLHQIPCVHADTRSHSGLSALHILAKNVKPVEVYSSRFADVRDRAIRRASASTKRLVTLLLDHKADINGVDRLGRTPLDLLLEHDQSEWFHLHFHFFVQCGAQFNHKYLDQFWSNFAPETDRSLHSA